MFLNGADETESKMFLNGGDETDSRNSKQMLQREVGEKAFRSLWEFHLYFKSENNKSAPFIDEDVFVRDDWKY